MTAPLQDSDLAVDVILRDGATLRLRAPVEADVTGLVEFFAALSVRSRFLRFHGLTVAGERFAQTLVEPDWAERGALIGVMSEVGEERIVQTFTYDGQPDGVFLETLWFEDLGDGRTRLHAQSLVESFEARDQWLASGMETGVEQGYAKLDAVIEEL